jgi:hypothetical protein
VVDTATETTTPTLLREIEKTGGVIRIQRTEYRGYPLVDVRYWARDYKSGELNPTRQGLSIRLEQFPEFLAAINGAASELPDLDADDHDAEHYSSDLFGEE